MSEKAHTPECTMFMIGGYPCRCGVENSPPMTDCTSPDWLQDAINAIQDLDTAQDLVDGVASLQQENERLKKLVLDIGEVPGVLDALLTGGE